MVEYHLGLTPGVIVGLILVLLVLTAMLVSTVVVVWRSRPAALARAQQKHLDARNTTTTDDLESGSSKPRASGELPVGILKKARSSSEDAEHDADSDSSIDGSPDLAPQTPHLGGSAVNVIIATDGAGGVEVRVTPPTPSQSLAALALKGERRVRFETLAGSTPGENESVWWFI